MDRSKIKLTFLLLAAALPISLATWFFGQNNTERNTTNNGTLIIPVLDITDFALQGVDGDQLFEEFEIMVEGIEVSEYTPRPWLLMYLGTDNCTEDCEQRLYFLRQLHVRLSAESGRVERYYVNASANYKYLNSTTEELFNTEYPSMKVAYSEPEALLDKLARTTTGGIDPIDAHYIYVVDPIGNVMMYFTDENPIDEILKDIDKLLDQSSLG